MKSFKEFGFLLFIICVSANSALQGSCCCHHCSESDDPRADYVIVGVGTAGAVLAKKLTDDKHTSVIALHGGRNLVENEDIKYSRNAEELVASGLLVGPPYYINRETVPQPNADDRELTWVLAKPLGGASSANAGAWLLGTDAVYSQWEALAGPKWSSQRIRRIFTKLEDYHGESDNPTSRGHHGPIDVRQVERPTTVGEKFTQAIITATGVPFVTDYNDPLTPIGVTPQLQYTQKGPNGALRVSSATAFLNHKVMLPNGFGIFGRKLRVHFKSKALKTLWEGNKAIGVEYVQDGQIKRAYANTGVIVCAGLYSSSFLMHSGVGPSATLNALGIPVIYDNPNVGQGLADQANVTVVFATNPADTTDRETNSIFDEIAFLPKPGGDPNTRSVRISATNLAPGVTAALVDLAPSSSRGSITINNANPLASPVIDLGELNDPADLTLFIQALQIYIKNINLAFQTIDPLYQLVYPDPAILDDVGLLTDFIKASVASNQCFQSHCRMAPLAQGGVVDGNGRVYGVQNLIVADNSINPVPMDGTPMSTGYLTAANIALILLGQ